MGEGDGQVHCSTSCSSSPRWRSWPGGASGSTGGRSPSSAAASRSTRSTGCCSSVSRRRPGGTSTPPCSLRSRGARARSTSTAPSQGANVYRPNALTGDPNHLGDRAPHAPARAAADLPPARAWPPAAGAADADADAALPDRARDVLAQRHARALLRPARARRSRTGTCFLTARFLRAARGRLPRSCSSFVAQRANFFQTVLKSRVDTSGKGTSTHFVVYEFIPQVLSQHPLFGLGLNNFSVYYEFVTGRNNFGPHSFYVALFVESGHRRRAALPRLPRLPLPPALGRARDRPGARRPPETASPPACARSSGA